jgi:hypothetical protein
MRLDMDAEKVGKRSGQRILVQQATLVGTLALQRHPFQGDLLLSPLQGGLLRQIPRCCRTLGQARHGSLLLPPCLQVGDALLEQASPLLHVRQGGVARVLAELAAKLVIEHARLHEVQELLERGFAWLLSDVVLVLAILLLLPIIIIIIIISIGIAAMG